MALTRQPRHLPPPLRQPLPEARVSSLPRPSYVVSLLFRGADMGHAARVRPGRRSRCRRRWTSGAGARQRQTLMSAPMSMLRSARCVLRAVRSLRASADGWRRERWQSSEREVCVFGGGFGEGGSAKGASVADGCTFHVQVRAPLLRCVGTLPFLRIVGAAWRSRRVVWHCLRLRCFTLPRAAVLAPRTSLLQTHPAPLSHPCGHRVLRSGRAGAGGERMLPVVASSGGGGCVRSLRRVLPPRGDARQRTLRGRRQGSRRGVVGVQ